MSDPLQTYDVDKIDELVAERSTTTSGSTFPKRSRRRWPTRSSPSSISSAISTCCSVSIPTSSTIPSVSTCGRSPRPRC